MMIDEKEFLSFIQSSQPEKVKVYLEKGRKFEKYSAEELKEYWVVVAKSCLSDPADDFSHQAMNYIESELSLRDLQPDYEALKAEIDAFAARFSERVQSIPAEELARINDEIATNFEEYLISKKRAN